MAKQRKDYTVVSVVPPNDISLERAIIHSAITGVDEYNIDWYSMIKKEYFYEQAHQDIWELIANGYNKLDTLMFEIHRRYGKDSKEFTAWFYILELQTIFPSEAKQHIISLIDYYIAREALRICTAGIQMVDNKLFGLDIVDKVEKELLALTTYAMPRIPRTLAQITAQGISIPPMYLTPDFMQALDMYYVLGGAITVWVARPKHGKSTIGGYLCVWYASQGIKTAFLSLEYSLEQSAMALNLIGLNYDKSLLYIPDLVNREADAICKELIRLDQMGVQVAVLDWIGLITYAGKAGSEAVANVCLMIQKTVVKLKMHLFILAQRKRPTINLNDLTIRPTADDIADSDNILRIATDVLIINKLDTDTYEDGTRTEGTREILHVARRRYSEVCAERQVTKLKERAVVYIHPNSTLSIDPPNQNQTNSLW
jgi:hypothetical protein